HGGDLALVDTEVNNYRVGQIVAYRNPQLGRVVLHRIVAESGNGYLLKGDNNDFVDFYRPSRNDLIGRLWLRVPLMGGVLLWLLKPFHVGIVGLLLGLVLVGGGSARRPRRRARDDHTPPTPQIPRPSVNRRSRALALARAMLALATIAGCVCAILLLIGYGHPVTRTQSTPGSFMQQGTYSYGALARPDSIYPNGRAATGQTIFARLVHRVELRFDYRLLSPLRHDVRGSGSLTATLRSGVGWRRMVTSKLVHFGGDTTTLVIPLDLNQLESQLGRYFVETGVPSDNFDLLVTPTISLRGHMAGQALHTRFAPQPLDFVLDRYTLRLSGSTGAGAGPGQAPADPLHPSATGTLMRREALTINLVGDRVRVSSVRHLGLDGLLAAALLALLAAAFLHPNRANDELGRIRRRYGHRILTVAAPPAAPSSGYVEVASFDSLAHVAARLERVICHHQVNGDPAFYLEDDGSIYRYKMAQHVHPDAVGERTRRLSRRLSQLRGARTRARGRLLTVPTLLLLVLLGLTGYALTATDTVAASQLGQTEQAAVNIPFVVTNLTSSDSGGTPGLANSGDTISLTFNQALSPSSIPASGTITLTANSSITTITMSGLTTAAGFTVATSYEKNGNTSSATVTYILSNGNRTVTATISGSFSNAGNLKTGSARTFIFSPTNTITDTHGTAAGGSYTTPAGITLF
ncbi:MAG TPA: DUF5305 family protein, partial [Gaiellaceae bacterium]|nr:DUF5305 family protein [Gaiellaceae bacterium]